MKTREAGFPKTVLFDGSGLDRWRARAGGPARWLVKGDVLEVAPGTGDIVTAESFSDFFLHLEFRVPALEAEGQAKGNSGVFLQGRYEIQILDSYGVGTPGTGDCGAVYAQRAPLVNACRPAMEWQSLDVSFRSARDGERACATILQNGIPIHNNVSLEVTKGALDDRAGDPGPLRLQDHRDLVSYRNIWITPLPLKGSAEYGPLP